VPFFFKSVGLIVKIVSLFLQYVILPPAWSYLVIDNKKNKILRYSYTLILKHHGDTTEDL